MSPVKFSMTKLRVLRWLAPVLAVLGAAASQFSEVGQQFLLERFDVRWYVGQNDLKQLVAVRNTGKDKLQGVQIRVTLPPHCLRPVADVACGQFEQGNQKSFMKTLLPIVQKKLDERLQPNEEFSDIKKAAQTNTLFDLDQFFLDLPARLRQKLKSVGRKKSPSPNSQPDFEGLQRELHAEGCEQWKSSSGMEVEFKPAELIPNLATLPHKFSMGLESLNLTTSIEGEDSRFLHVTHGPEQIEATTTVSLTAGKRLNKMTDKNDLTASDPWLFFKYDLALTILLIALVVATGWLINWARKPVQTYALVNFALRTKDGAELGKALEQHSSFIVTHFQNTCWAANRKPEHVDNASLLLHARHWLEGRYANKRRAFADNAEMETALRQFLTQLIGKLPRK